MEEFFKDIESETESDHKPNPMKTIESDSESETKQSKRDIRLQQLKSDIEVANKGMTNKNIDKVVRTINKNVKFYKKENLDFLKSFCDSAKNNKKINATTKNKLAAAVEEVFMKEEKIDFSVASNRPKQPIQDEISKIVFIGDIRKRIESFDELLKRNNNSNDKFRIIYTKLLNVGKSEDRFGSVCYECILELDLLYEKVDSELKTLFLSTIENILEFTKKEEKYLEIIEIMGKYNKGVCELKRLEFEYFVRGVAVETENKEFILLYLVRNGNMEEAKDFYFENNQWLLKNNTRQVLDAMLTLADYCLETYPVESFKMLQHCHYFGRRNVPILNALCCALNEKIKAEKYFVEFLDGIILLEDNPLLLNSFDPRMNFYRAFFLYINGDKKGSCEVLKEMELNLPEKVYKLLY